MAAPSMKSRLRLRVAPGARGRTSDAIERHGSAWKVRVQAPPDDGKANEAVLRLLATRLELPRSSLSLVSGHSAKDKIVELTGIDVAEAERRLSTAGER
jgi:uncharacterized protein